MDISDIKKATRLTRVGRLREAMATLRGMTGTVGAAEPAVNGAGDRSGTRAPSIFARPPSFNIPALDIDAALGRRRNEAPVGPPIASGAAFLDRSFANDQGSRAYKLYVPSGCRGQPLPLVVMLHGCTQSPDDFALGTRMNEIAEEATVLVAYPAQSTGANAQKCWNWFDRKDQGRGKGEASLVAGIVRQIMTDQSVAAGRVYVAGLSAGAAAAANLGFAYPDLFAAIGVHSGLACGVAKDIPSAFAAMKQGGVLPKGDGRGRVVPTIVFHGDRDATVVPVNGDRVIEQAKHDTDLRVVVTRGRATGGLAFTRTVHSDDRGRSVLEQWTVHGAGHAWSGGSPAGSYTEPHGPDASREMMRFFAEHAATR